MRIENTLTICIRFRTAKDLEEVQRLTAEIGTSYKQAGIYLAGLRAIAKLLKKS